MKYCAETYRDIPRMRRHVRSQGLERSVRIRSHGTYHVEDNEALWDNGGTAWAGLFCNGFALGVTERKGQGMVGLGKIEGRGK